MPASAAAVAAAPLTEWALNMDVPRPAFSSTDFIHRAIVALVAGPYGFMDVRKTAGFICLFSSVLHFCVFLQ